MSEKPRQGQEQVDPEMMQAREHHEEFMGNYSEQIYAYFGSSKIPITFEPGGWYLRLEKDNPSINMDPDFFMKKGYTMSEAIFATFHEGEHLRDMVTSPEVYETLKQRINTKKDIHKAYPKILFSLYNCLEDVLVNRLVMTRWSAAGKKGVTENLYRDKLFPERDLTEQPRHRQLMYALLRNAMLPEEPALVSPEVQQALNEWQARGKATQYRKETIDILTEVNLSSKMAAKSTEDRFNLIKVTLEPIFEKFFLEDLKDKEEKDKEKGEGEEGEGEKDEKGETGEDDPFGDDPFADAVPDPLDYEESQEATKKLKDLLNAKDKDKLKEAYGGVDQKEIDRYAKELLKVQDHVKKLAETFKQLITDRLVPHRKLKAIRRTGVMINPSSAAIAYASKKAHIDDPRVMRDFKTEFKKTEHPNRLEFTLVCDGSGSMDSAEKKDTQRLIAILVMEAFAKFTDDLKKESTRLNTKIPFSVASEVRLFNDTDNVLKPLSETLDHASRVGVRTKLKAPFNAGNNEIATLDAIQNEQFTKQKCKDLQTGDLIKVVLFLTDGETDQNAIQRKIATLQHMGGVDKDGKSSLLIAGIGFAEGRSAIDTYAPNGYYAEEISDLVPIVQNFIESCLKGI